MKAAYTIHELVVKGERVSPKTVIELDDDAFAELESLDAIRPATSDEIAIAGLSAPVAEKVEKKPTAAEKKAAKEAAKAAEAQPQPQPEPSVDPDERDSDLLDDQ